jgi:hypothetical protein
MLQSCNFAIRVAPDGSVTKASTAASHAFGGVSTCQVMEAAPFRYAALPGHPADRFGPCESGDRMMAKVVEDDAARGFRG